VDGLLAVGVVVLFRTLMGLELEVLVVVVMELQIIQLLVQLQ